VSKYPKQFDGAITISWPAPDAAYGVLEGWRVQIRGEDGEPIIAAASVTLHADPERNVWAELEMLMADDGEPIRNGSKLARGDDGEPATRTFRYYVTGMSVQVLEGATQ